MPTRSRRRWPNAKEYGGNDFDDESGLIYRGARYCDPKLARFFSTDTIVPDPGNPQALNRYTSCCATKARFYTASVGYRPLDIRVACRRSEGSSAAMLNWRRCCRSCCELR
ncbi:MAG: RHS repeat-associated core domain-containing protein [Gammaproteobacteria bacterium]